MRRDEVALSEEPRRDDFFQVKHHIVGVEMAGGKAWEKLISSSRLGRGRELGDLRGGRVARAQVRQPQPQPHCLNSFRH